MSTHGVRLESATKRYGEFTAVSEIDLEIPGGGYYCLLGPSGSGKSTILRLIAGLETLTSGRVLIGDADVSTVMINSLSSGEPKTLPPSAPNTSLELLVRKLGPWYA